MFPLHQCYLSPGLPASVSGCVVQGFNPVSGTVFFIQQWRSRSIFGLAVQGWTCLYPMKMMGAPCSRYAAEMLRWRERAGAWVAVGPALLIPPAGPNPPHPAQITTLILWWNISEHFLQPNCLHQPQGKIQSLLHQRKNQYSWSCLPQVGTANGKVPLISWPEESRARYR